MFTNISSKDLMNQSPQFSQKRKIERKERNAEDILALLASTEVDEHKNESSNLLVTNIL